MHPTTPGAPKRVQLVGLGKAGRADAESVRRAAARASSLATDKGERNVALWLPAVRGVSQADAFAAAGADVVIANGVLKALRGDMEVQAALDEAAGIVDAIGPDVDGIALGERYCTLPYFYYDKGASTESMLVDARYVTRAPDGLSAVEAASIWMQYMTAFGALIEYGKLQKKASVLITAASSRSRPDTSSSSPPT